MILELVEFNSPKGWSREQMAEDARNVIPRWRDNKELLRKHFLLELNGKTGAGVYIWPSVEAAKKAHNEEWRQSIIKRTGGAPTSPSTTIWAESTVPTPSSRSSALKPSFDG